MTISWTDPHTTSEKSRTCLECHTDPRAMGLGAGSLEKIDGKWHFAPATAIDRRRCEERPRLDGFVDISGKALVLTSRTDLRPFNQRELNAILNAGQCLLCHKSFDDKVMKGWNPLSPPKPCDIFFEQQ